MPTQRRSRLTEGNQVLFHIADVTNMDPITFLQSADPNLMVPGKIIYFSDSGKEKAKYTVLAVEGLLELVVVPTAKLRKI